MVGPVVPVLADLALGRFGLKGFLELKTRRFDEPVTVSVAATTTDFWSAGVLVFVGSGAASECRDFFSTTGTATSATTRTRATGHSRRLRRSCQRSRMNLFIAFRCCYRSWWAW